MRPAMTLVVLLLAHLAQAQTTVTLHRIPDGGVQPQVAVDASGVAHLIYLKGDPAHADVFYTRSNDAGVTWSPPLRVNTHPGSAIALGTVRGAHLALGRNARPSVAWMGAAPADPKATRTPAPMLYTRLADDGRAFEPERNLITVHPGLDGGGSLAADDLGNVFVAWHAPATPGGDEQSRRVFVARSTDDGKSFAPELPVSDPATGACGCCGMRAFATGGKLFVLYRGAAQMVNRGMYLVETTADLHPLTSREIAPQMVGTCIMSTAAFAPSAANRNVLVAWETKGVVAWAAIDPSAATPFDSHPVSPARSGQKFPAVTANASGQVLVAWAVGTGWNKGGRVAWAVFDPSGHPVPDKMGDADGLPAWDCPAAFATPNGNFVVLY